MWSFLLAFLASLAASMSCLALSKTVHRGASVGGYLSIYFLISFLVSALLNGIFTTQVPLNGSIAVIGLLTGIFVIIMMIMMGKALQEGPSGLTFAFQNSGAILPAILLALIFKSPFGFILTPGNLLGMALVVGGLLFAAKGGLKGTLSKKWVFFAFFTFFLQATILTIYQWRCLLLDAALPSHIFIPFTCSEADDIWFMPSMFLSATTLQLIFFYFKERRWLTKVELFGGAMGGVANGLSTFFLLKATWVATGLGKAMLFPLFTVLVILLCNVSGKFFYKEKINWGANACCALGILVGMLF